MSQQQKIAAGKLRKLAGRSVLWRTDIQRVIALNPSREISLSGIIIVMDCFG
jgi:hypothetical protein